MSHKITHQRLAELVGGELAQGDPEGVVTGLNSITEAVPGEVTFLGNPRYLPALKTTKATAILVGGDFAESMEGVALIKVANPTFAFSSVIRHFGPPARDFTPGVHSTACVSSKATFDPQQVSIGPMAVVGDDVVIGDGTTIGAGVCIGQGARLGEDCFLHANCTIGDRCVLGNRVIIHSGTVIGSDGFGYEFVKGRHVKIDQVGIVQIDDDVEIGAACSVDRARFGRTWIGAGTKIDNQVQIAHNAIVGKHCIIVAHVALAGSVRMGDYVTLAGQVAIGGHLEICNQVTILAKSGVTKNITEPGAYMGFPAKPLMEHKRQLAAQSKIPDLMDRIRTLEKRLAALEGGKAEG
ncbi:UDP-3-O-(3-hydroxymyristoyl)glucosamine N-acyltransferase [Brevifollis gellanilyticus]|uniref:UDP-3-O-acylglucosamine N-acyltransferase n=1 Tax=Brevifollis gellanilyticus TaxID=748831 RepID=A0A512MH45_9BACT|nr:UDP-3-O-(3-hydroxymyristoyl)glucosamine N-acyltransferase [Brevifollis gellanilyticus]GEP46060.1 UDP-3-O-acylglucosamine N-acyltransferase [Brevifollis gellanilyticus]